MAGDETGRVATESELLAEVDLCDRRGRLAAEARGWARHPMLRANLRGAWGRKKRWDYWCVITPEVIASLVYADLDYAGTASCSVLDRTDERCAAAGVIRPFARGMRLPDQVCTGVAELATENFEIRIAESEAATRLEAAGPSSVGRISIDVTVAKPAGHESLNVVVPWSARRFQFTSKQNTRPATGTITVGDRTYIVGETEDFAVQDLGRGIWPYSIRWNWAAASGRATDGRLVGLQFGGKWTEGTGSTENALCVDGRLTKIHEELDWSYDWDDPMRPWRVRGEGVDVTLVPEYDRYDLTDLKLVRMEVHQCFGRWSGTIHTETDGELTLAGIDGFAEEARNRW